MFVTDHKLFFSDKGNLCREYFIFNYIIIISMISIFLFLYGFFPVSYTENIIASQKDIPKFVQDSRYLLYLLLKKIIN